jgi:SAM-dependent methyltransferase
MLAHGYHEDLWQAIPEGAQPAGLKRRLDFVLRHLGAHRRILDVGCGEAQITAELGHGGAQVVGIDPAAEPLRRALAKHPQLDLRVISMQEPWPLQNASFDLVWAGEVIEHVADTAGWLSEVRRVLRSDGTLLLSTPAHDLLHRLGLALRPGAFAAHFDPRADHLRFYTRATLRTLLEDFGFHDIRVGATGGIPGGRQTILASAVRSRF